MYTIKQAAARTGVSVELLRVWERRYGVVHPVRTPSGYRLYDEDSIARIRAMRALMDDGWAPSTASASIAERTRADIAELAGRATAPGGGSVEPAMGPPAPTTDATHELIERFAAATASGQPAELAAVLDEIFARGSFERVVAELVGPALALVGERWAGGQLGVDLEHVASHAVLRRLAAAFEAAGRERTSGLLVLVGLPPGARHELGTLAFGTAARRAGLSITYLGPDLPVEDWLAAARSARAAVIGVPTARDRRGARAVATRLRQARPDLIVAVGGPAASPVDDVISLPADIGAAVAELSAAVGRPV
jgi:DNA-binding transcriptional MerR regulator/methylmalonyl-CoA mutase cobalamin-binding subunit